MPIRRPRLQLATEGMDANTVQAFTTLQESLDQLVADISALRDGRLYGHVNASTLPVLAGAKGDFVKYNAPVVNADGSILLGWICTVAGAAGASTWEEVHACDCAAGGLDGLTASVTELNFVDGVTSAIQTQLNNKQASDSDLTAIAALTPDAGSVIIGNGSTWVAQPSTEITHPAYTEQTSSFTAAEYSSHLITGNSVTVTLPASPFVGTWVEVALAPGVTGATMDPNGEYLQDSTSAYALTAGTGLVVSYVSVASIGAGWYIVKGGP